MELADRIAAHTDYLTPLQAAEELSVEVHSIHAWAKRDFDPLPVRLPPGNTRQGRIFRPELNEWVLRNWPTRAESM